MSFPTFGRFLALAGQHQALLLDLCAEPDVISRAQLLAYLEARAVAAVEKEPLIDRLCQAAILIAEGDQGYTVNPVVAGLVNYYERRGRLTSAAFLRDQIIAIANLADELQRQLFSPDTAKEAISDTVDNLYHLVREVRESGDGHYMACMRAFGDLKRTTEGKSLDQQLTELERIQRRHIAPLDELINPSGEYAHKMTALKRRLADLAGRSDLLAESQELDSRRRRLQIDLAYIDRVLLARFTAAADTARSLLKSLLEEKNLKDALAACLGNLAAVWQHLEPKTVLATGRQFSQAPPLDDLSDFFAGVVQGKLLKRPVALHPPTPQKQYDNEELIRPAQVWQQIAGRQHISSWPRFVVESYDGRTSSAQLKAITLPLIIFHPQVAIQRHTARFCHQFPDFEVEMNDFAVQWREGAS